MAECEWVAGGGAGGTSFKLLSSLYSQSTTWDCLVFTIIGSANLLLSVYSTYSIMLFTVLPYFQTTFLLSLVNVTIQVTLVHSFVNTSLRILLIFTFY